MKPLKTDAIIIDWGDNFATVSLNWTQEGIKGIHYFVTIEPPADMQCIGNTSGQLTVDYNELYNISITATVCGQNYSSGIRTVFVGEIFFNNSFVIFNHYINFLCDACMHAARCNSSLHLMDSFVHTYFNIPALEGATANFSCPPNFVLTGPTTATCMGNGEWEPDLNEIKCAGKFLYRPL